MAGPSASDNYAGVYEGRLQPGSRPALLVPQAFVTTRYGIDYVTVLGRNGAASEVPVQTTPSGEAGKVEILSGVRAGDTLVGRP